MDAELSERNPREATAEVVEGAMRLVRAELTLFASYARSIAQRAGFSIALGWLAVTLGQLAIVLIVLSPILVPWRPWQAVLLSILLAIASSAAAAAGTLWSLRSVRAVLDASSPSSTNDSIRSRSQP